MKKSPKTYFRFLLTKSRWKLDKYEKDPNSTLKEAINDLDPNADNLSIFKIKDKKKQNDISELEIIAFLFSASSRIYASDLHYIDIPHSDIKKIGMKIRKKPSTSNLKFKYYANKHYEIYPMNRVKRRELAILIFNYIALKENKKLSFISKTRFKKLKEIIYNDKRLKGLDVSKFSEWAI